MSKKLTYERFLWFHGRIKEKKYPNATHLCEEFEIAERTARRDIAFMCNHLDAPLTYNRARRGYYYTDDTYELPAGWIDENNVLSLALAVRLASTIPDRTLKDELCRLIDRVVGPDYSTGRRLCHARISEKISVKNIEYARVNEQFFQLTVTALLTDLPLRISYRSPHSGAVTERTIQPLHLLHYMGSWHLLAWCASRKAIRNFALSRLLQVETSADTLLLPAGLPPIKEYTRRHFGIIQGGETREVTLRFSARIASRIQEQVWHSRQQLKSDQDGSLLLSFPTADFRELTKVILGYGAEVQVVAPKDLQSLIKKEIKKMNKIYLL